MLGRKSLVVFLGEWCTFALQIAASILLARALGPDVVGRVAFAFGLIGMLVMFTGLGFVQAHIKRVAEGFPVGLAVSTQALISVSLNLIAVITCMVLWPLWLGKIFENKYESIAFILFFGYQIIVNLTGIITATFQGRSEFAKLIIVSSFGKLVRVIGTIVVIIFSPNLLGVGIVFFVEAICQLSIAIKLIYNSVRLVRPTKESLNSYWRYAKPLTLLTPLGVFGDSVDRVVLRNGWPAAEIGYYNTSRTLFEPIKTISSAAITTLFPRFAQDYAQLGKEAMGKRFYESLRKLILIATPFTVLGVFFSGYIINLLYGHKFVLSTVPLAIFFGVSWVISLVSPFHYLIYAIERHKAFLWISPLSQGCYFIGLLALTTKGLNLGAIGAAIASALPMIISVIPVASIVRKHLDIKFPWKTLRLALAGIIMAIVLFLFFRATGNIYIRLFAAGLSLLVYWVSAVVLKQASRYDLDYLMDQFNLNKFFVYIKGELKGARQ